MRLAIYNFGMFRERAEDPANQGFRDRERPNFVASERAPGFIARSGYAGEPGPPSWGQQVFPRFYVERGDGWSPATLSLWNDLESLMAFTYFGVHAEALGRASDWFVEQQWPPYVLWWVADSHTPGWKEAVERFEHLDDHGPTPTAFNFQIAFDEQGLRTSIDRQSAAQLARSGA
jgi:hypothetical protein